jgi:hypothetical protein
VTGRAPRRGSEGDGLRRDRCKANSNLSGPPNHSPDERGIAAFRFLGDFMPCWAMHRKKAKRSAAVPK